MEKAGPKSTVFHAAADESSSIAVNSSVKEMSLAMEAGPSRWSGTADWSDRCWRGVTQRRPNSRRAGVVAGARPLSLTATSLRADALSLPRTRIRESRPCAARMGSP